VDQSPNRSWGFLDCVDRRRGCTYSCGGSGDKSVLGEGECKSDDRANVSSTVEDVSSHAGEKFSTLFEGGWLEATSKLFCRYWLGTWSKVLNLKLTWLFPVHPVNVLQNTSDYSPQGQQGHTRDHLCCECGGAKVQVQGAVAMKGVQNQSWLCGETVRSVYEEFHLWKGKQGIGQHEGLPVTKLPSLFPKDVCYAATA